MECIDTCDDADIWSRKHMAMLVIKVINNSNLYFIMI